MSIHVFQLEQDGDYHTLDTSSAQSAQDVDAMIAKYASELTKKKVIPGSMNWYGAKATSVEAAIAEAKENSFSFVDPAKMIALSQRASNLSLSTAMFLKPGSQN